MAILENRDSGARVVLRSETTIGRSRQCVLRLDEGRVSGHHALVRWASNRWELRDLGSRNGTYVDGALAREATLRVGAVLGFGRPDAEWEVLSTTAPGPLAVDDDGLMTTADGGFLVIEHGEQAVAVWAERGGWILEDHLGERREAPSELVVGGAHFSLDLPSPSPRTVDEVPLRCSTVAFRFHVPRNEEGIRLVVLMRDEQLVSTTSATVELLYRLARARADQSALAPAERGWMLTDDLVRALGYRDRRHLAVVVHRARRVAAQAGLTDASDVVERDTATDSLRFGGIDVGFERA